MILALDFDRTLFDTEGVVEIMEQRGVAHLIGDPQVHDSVDPKLFLYPDTIPFLQSYGRNKLFVVSAITFAYGPRATEYQKDKIYRSGVAELVSEVMLTGDSKVEALTTLTARFPHEQVVFIDDRADVLHEVHHALPQVIVIHMMRDGAKRISNLPLPEYIPVSRTLDECATILKSYV